ncbi:MAG: hypothetical protein K9N09_00010 [Candidatus Cloacimonetes bacterium]|nr:hypothetical protein [Candidatus Cloacimonadota bacterium]MCF7812845.1 hypothetical protein [Candidatus Cloacimonadota bacterium]MCF7867057.1 hypothetical protein [Candidatus Cloacimonadota bacterium]
MKGEDGIVHELRVNGKPEKCHNEIYQKLNLKFKFNRKYHDVKVRM